MVAEPRLLEQLCEAAYVELAGALQHMTEAELYRESGHLQCAEISRKQAINQARQAQELIEAVIAFDEKETSLPQCCALA